MNSVAPALTRRQSWREELEWHRSLLPRAAALWQFKTLSACVIAFSFFAAYFALLNHPQFEVTPMPSTALDDLVAFVPSSLLIYLTLWIYISLPPGLLDSHAELLRYYAGIAGLAICGLVIFLVWPTSSPRPDIDWTQYPVFGPLLAVDRSGNACPSLHAAFAVFTAIWFDRFLRHPGDRGLSRSLNWLWCIGILYSTLATKQHVAVDLFAGVLFGIAGAKIHGLYFKRPAGFPNPSPRAP